MEKQIKVQCLCEGTGFISQVDSVGDDTELVECAEHHPAYEGGLDDRITVLDKVRLPDGSIGTVSQWEEEGVAKVYCGLSQYDGRTPCYKYVHRNELVKVPSAASPAESEDDERTRIINGLTPAQEDALKEAHAEDYHGTDDDMPDAFEGWLEDLSLDELKSILA